MGHEMQTVAIGCGLGEWARRVPPRRAGVPHELGPMKDHLRDSAQATELFVSDNAVTSGVESVTLEESARGA